MKWPATILAKYGNTGGPSVPLTMSLHCGENPVVDQENVMLLGYGVGLCWGSAVVCVNPDTRFIHGEM